METNYFTDCQTEADTKKMFKHLSKILHPDLGGTDELFRDMADQYHAKLKSLSGSYNSKEDEAAGKRQYFYDAEIESDLLNMIKALQGLRMPEIVEISLQGTWIWVKGVTKNHYGHYPLNPRFIPQLENLGLKLHTAKGEMYYRDPKNRCNKNHKVMPFDRINKRYRGYTVANAGSEQLN